MDAKECPMFVDSEECRHALTRVDLEAEKIARYDLATYQCSRAVIARMFCSSRDRKPDLLTCSTKR
jgi:hypothetical protein